MTDKDTEDSTTATVGAVGDAAIWGLEAFYYRDEATYRAMLEKLFYRSWIFAAHNSEVAVAGDYKCFRIGEQECFLLRGKDGRLRAFYNVCRHRGHILLPPQSSGRLKDVLVCPYHAWAYELSGVLRKAPSAGRGLAELDIRLSEIPCEDFLGFIFVNLDLKARPMDEVFGGVKKAITDVCPDITERKSVYEHHAEEHCHWLVAVENYNECYHCSFVHKQFSKGVVRPESYDIRPFGSGRCLRHAAAAASEDSAWYDTGGGDYASFYLFPAFSLQIYPSRLVNSYHWVPLAVDNTRVHRGWYGAPSATRESLAEVIRLDKETTFAEDLQLVKGVQAGVVSRGYEPGPLVISDNFGINSEHSIVALHNWVREALEV